MALATSYRLQFKEIKMTKNEYEAKLSELSGALEDLQDSVSEIQVEIKNISAIVDYLPELSELEENE
jgi:predicted  nucleic acid-binding Zn-ribbon protein